MDPILEFTSHVSGRNAKVRVFPTHLEVDAPKKRSKGAALATGGLSLLGARKREVDTIPMRSVSGVSVSGRMGNSELMIVSSGMVLTARVSKSEAERIKSTILGLMTA